MPGAHFEFGKVWRADFSGADLRCGQLQHADLGVCDFDGADLTGADFTGTKVVIPAPTRGSGGSRVQAIGSIVGPGKPVGNRSPSTCNKPGLTLTKEHEVDMTAGRACTRRCRFGCAELCGLKEAPPA